MPRRKTEQKIYTTQIARKKGAEQGNLKIYLKKGFKDLSKWTPRQKASEYKRNII